MKYNGMHMSLLIHDIKDDLIRTSNLFCSKIQDIRECMDMSYLKLE